MQRWFKNTFCCSRGSEFSSQQPCEVVQDHLYFCPRGFYLLFWPPKVPPTHMHSHMMACGQNQNFKIVMLKYLNLLSSLLYQRRYIRNLWTEWEGQQKVQAQHQESYLEILTSAEVSLFHISRSTEAISSIKSFFSPQSIFKCMV